MRDAPPLCVSNLFERAAEADRATDDDADGLTAGERGAGLVEFGAVEGGELVAHA